MDTLPDPRDVAFADERKRGIGGSDMGSLFNKPPYGCRRRLWYEKAGFAPDFDHDAATLARFRRGHDLEPFVALEYAKATGRNIVLTNTLIVDREHDYIRAHPDAWIIDPDGPDGILSIKTIGESTSRLIKKDPRLVLIWNLQLNYEIAISALKWGAIACWNVDRWAWEYHQDHQFIPQVAKEQFDAVDQFWHEYILDPVHDFPEPDKLPDGDTRCKSCRWRLTCKGEQHLDSGDGDRVEDAYLEMLAEIYVDARARASVADKEKKKAGEEIKDLLTVGFDALVGAYRVKIKAPTARIDTDSLRAAHPDIAEKFMKVGDEPSLDIRPIKGYSNEF